MAEIILENEVDVELNNFDIVCRDCGSENVTVNVKSNKLIFFCTDCEAEEEIEI